MKRTIILYGMALATLVTLMKIIEYRHFVKDLSLEFYVGTVAFLCTGIGVWAGLQLTKKKIVLASPDFHFDAVAMDRHGISRREVEVLELTAQGLSNQEIADKLFLSPNTVKTHLSNLFVKLNVSRRTQAIQKAKILRLIP